MMTKESSRHEKGWHVGSVKRERLLRDLAPPCTQILMSWFHYVALFEKSRTVPLLHEVVLLHIHLASCHISLWWRSLRNCRRPETIEAD
jgi:hypothetical protein